MSILGSIGLGFVDKVINSAFGRSDARYESKLQAKQAKYINSNKHQWEVEDLRDAGLNPILSATNGMGYANAGTVGVDSSDKTETAALSQNLHIAKMQNATQKEFNQEANRIALKNAITQEGLANSSIALNKKQEVLYTNQALKMLSDMAIAAEVGKAQARMYDKQGDASLISANAAADQAATAREHFNAKKSIYDFDSKIKGLQYNKLSSDPLTGEHGKKLGAVDKGLNYVERIARIVRGGGSSAYTFNNYGDYYHE